jgi:hypothetical protein
MCRFVEDPKIEHGQALRRLGRYLKGTRNKGTTYYPDESRGLEVFVDASFSQDWRPEDVLDRDSARSRHGFYVTYASCPIQWKSQLRTEITLSSTESEYTGLRYALRDAIPMMQLLGNLKTMASMYLTLPRKCIARFSKIIAAHGRWDESQSIGQGRNTYVLRSEILIYQIDMLDQPADILTKPVNEETLLRLRKVITGSQDLVHM